MPPWTEIRVEDWKKELKGRRPRCSVRPHTRQIVVFLPWLFLTLNPYSRTLCSIYCHLPRGVVQAPGSECQLGLCTTDSPVPGRLSPPATGVLTRRVPTQTADPRPASPPLPVLCSSGPAAPSHPRSAPHPGAIFDSVSPSSTAPQAVHQQTPAGLAPQCFRIPARVGFPTTTRGLGHHRLLPVLRWH